MGADDVGGDAVAAGRQFDSEGEYVSQFGASGSDLAVGPEDHIYIASYGNNRVAEFDQAGEHLRNIGSSIRPKGVDLAPNGDIWVAEGGCCANQVSVYDSEGEQINSFGETDSGNGQFKDPSGITVDGNGFVWVGDSDNYRVQAFDSEGEYITQFGEACEGEGQFHGGNAMRIAVSPQGDVWVNDVENWRVQRWSPPWWML